MSSIPIAEHALLSDCHSAALVTRSGSVDWLTWPRFDSPSCFARLLDQDAGHWSITPVEPGRTERRYAERSLVLETTFHTPTGTMTLTEALAVGAENTGHQLGRGAPHLLVRRLRCTLEETPARVWTQEELRHRLESTVAAWRSWSALHQQYQGPWADLVQHSGRVLQGLTFQPSGAIVAAATTSLPEGVGGKRNWDYRYSWVRDASFTMEALWVAACPDEATDFFAFMTTAAAAVGLDTPLQIMFGVGGEHDLTERTLPHLAGWRDSRPVRVGNGAWNQQQIDVYGELLGAAHRLADHITVVDDDMRGFLVALADSAAHRWREPDQGIWEVRGEPRHFL